MDYLRVMALTIVYVANIIVAGWIGITSLFRPKLAVHTVFSDSFEYSESISLVGAMWITIAVLSVIGLFYPKEMSLVLLFQLIYKSSWILFCAIPAMINAQAYPKHMAGFFAVWIIILPFVIPWKDLF